MNNDQNNFDGQEQNDEENDENIYKIENNQIIKWKYGKYLRL